MVAMGKQVRLKRVAVDATVPLSLSRRGDKPPFPAEVLRTKGMTCSGMGFASLRIFHLTKLNAKQRLAR